MKNVEYVAKRELEANGGATRDIERGKGHNGYTHLPMEDIRKSSEIDIDIDEAIRELEGQNGRDSKNDDEA